MIACKTSKSAKNSAGMAAVATTQAQNPTSSDLPASSECPNCHLYFTKKFCAECGAVVVADAIVMAKRHIEKLFTGVVAIQYTEFKDDEGPRLRVAEDDYTRAFEEASTVAAQALKKIGGLPDPLVINIERARWVKTPSYARFVVERVAVSTVSEFLTRCGVDTAAYNPNWLLGFQYAGLRDVAVEDPSNTAGPSIRYRHKFKVMTRDTLYVIMPCFQHEFIPDNTPGPDFEKALEHQLDKEKTAARVTTAAGLHGELSEAELDLVIKTRGRGFYPWGCQKYHTQWGCGHCAPGVPAFNGTPFAKLLGHYRQEYERIPGEGNNTAPASSFDALFFE